MDNQLLYKIALTKIPGVGPVTARNLVSYCGGLEEIFRTSRKKLMKIPGIGPLIADKILKKDIFVQAERELTFVEKQHIRPLFFLDKDYPERLKPYQNSPVILYYKGNCDLNARRIVAIIGTRKPDLQGRMLCESFVEDLAVYDVMVVSGLAYGIDAVAHRACVSSGVPTVGVLGHGLKRLYPAVHKKLAMEMLECGGLLTEYSSNTPPDREHFPMRNRIVAGLCDALIVVQTAKRGGSIISVEFATRYNKDVFAFPGRVGDENHAGCNHLIKSHKAALIESVADLAYVMRWEKKNKEKAVQQELFTTLSQKERSLVGLFRKYEEISIDKLSYTSGMEIGEIAALLLSLEFKGVVKPLPGKRFILF